MDFSHFCWCFSLNASLSTMQFLFSEIVWIFLYLILKLNKVLYIYVSLCLFTKCLDLQNPFIFFGTPYITIWSCIGPIVWVWWLEIKHIISWSLYSYCLYFHENIYHQIGGKYVPISGKSRKIKTFTNENIHYFKMRGFQIFIFQNLSNFADIKVRQNSNASVRYDLGIFWQGS